MVYAVEQNYLLARVHLAAEHCGDAAAASLPRALSTAEIESRLVAASDALNGCMAEAAILWQSLR